MHYLFRPQLREALRGFPLQLVAPAQLHYAPPLENSGASCDLWLEGALGVVLSCRLRSIYDNCVNRRKFARSNRNLVVM